MRTLLLQKTNFGLTGLSNYSSYDEGYDHLFKKFKEKRAEKKQRKEDEKADRKQRTDDKRAERQEKRELANEKRRLKNEMKQAQIEEKKTQTTMLNQVGAPPAGGGPPSAGSDNTMMIVAGIVGVIVIAGVGYVVLNKKPAPAAPQIHPA